MRVLLIKTSSLGDVVHTFPALSDAQQARPEIRFDWVVEEAFAELPSWHPAIEQVLPIAIRRWRKQPVQTLRSAEWQQCKARLAQPYDLVIDAQGLLKSAWLTCYTNAPVVGFSRASVRDPLARLFYQRGYSVPAGLHAIERLRHLFAQALDYPLPSGPGRYGLDRTRLVNTEKPPYLVFLHGTTWPSKHWPEPYWRTLAEQLAGQGLHIRLPWGNAQELARAERLAAGLPTVKVLPRLNLADVAGVIADAQACVAVDTGLGHLAAALDVPTVSLYGPTLPAKVGTYGRAQIHLCETGPQAGSGNREQLCFRELNPARVLPVINALLHNAESA